MKDLNAFCFLLLLWACFLIILIINQWNRKKCPKITNFSRLGKNMAHRTTMVAASVRNLGLEPQLLLVVSSVHRERVIVVWKYYLRQLG